MVAGGRTEQRTNDLLPVPPMGKARKSAALVVVGVEYDLLPGGSGVFAHRSEYVQRFVVDENVAAHLGL